MVYIKLKHDEIQQTFCVQYRPLLLMFFVESCIEVGDHLNTLKLNHYIKTFSIGFSTVNISIM
ncbi:unnamed protein product [Paramecium octaurelia]|uniref:Uncharacterized protein n=1 Tax=Paramecium octaurelia TaxID=43137 RepID=A0A8S1WPJ9_PAROT|nr:unnamed protein product [Paramecium octaurelia]